MNFSYTHIANTIIHRSRIINQIPPPVNVNSIRACVFNPIIHTRSHQINILKTTFVHIDSCKKVLSAEQEYKKADIVEKPCFLKKNNKEQKVVTYGYVIFETVDMIRLKYGIIKFSISF